MSEFLLGVAWCCKAMREAADRVAVEQRGDVTSLDGIRTAHNAVIKSGNHKLARQLREIAAILEQEAGA